MIRRVLKRGLKLGVAVAKVATREVRELVRPPPPPTAAEAPLDEAVVDDDVLIDSEHTPVAVLGATALGAAMDAGEPLVLLDCRELHEWEAGYVAPCVHIPANDLPDRWRELEPAARTVVYCLHGMRSAEVAMWLTHKAGFADVASLDGGIVSWYAEMGQARIVVVRSEDH